MNSHRIREPCDARLFASTVCNSAAVELGCLCAPQSPSQAPFPFPVVCYQFYLWCYMRSEGPWQQPRCCRRSTGIVITVQVYPFPVPDGVSIIVGLPYLLLPNAASRTPPPYDSTDISTSSPTNGQVGFLLPINLVIFCPDSSFLLLGNYAIYTAPGSPPSL